MDEVTPLVASGDAQVLVQVQPLDVTRRYIVERQRYPAAECCHINRDPDYRLCILHQSLHTSAIPQRQCQNNLPIEKEHAEDIPHSHAAVLA